MYLRPCSSSPGLGGGSQLIQGAADLGKYTSLRSAVNVRRSCLLATRMRVIAEAALAHSPPPPRRSKLGLLSVHIWSAFGLDFVCVWSAFGSHFVCVWSAFCLLLGCVWSAFGLQFLFFWSTFCLFLVCYWFAFYLFLVCILHAFDMLLVCICLFLVCILSAFDLSKQSCFLYKQFISPVEVSGKVYFFIVNSFCERVCVCVHVVLKIICVYMFFFHFLLLYVRVCNRDLTYVRVPCVCVVSACEFNHIKHI